MRKIQIFVGGMALLVSMISFDALAAGFGAGLEQLPQSGGSAVKQTKFESIDDVLKRNNIPQRVGASAVAFMVQGEQVQPDGRTAASKEFCSGSFVSDKGHILTAAHCLTGCVRKVNGKDLCKFELPDKVIEVEVVFSSKCDYDLQKMKPTPAIESKWALNRKICENAIDMAVVLPPESEKMMDKQSTCLKLVRSDGLPPLGTKLVKFGIGAPTFRKNGPNSKDLEFMANEGNVSDGKTCKVLDTHGSKGSFKPDDIGKTFALPEGLKPERMAKQGYFFSTLDGIDGNSGSPFVNTKGEVVGVYSASVARYLNKYDECAGAAVGVSVSSLREAANQWKPGLGERIFDELSCEKKSATASSGGSWFSPFSKKGTSN